MSETSTPHATVTSTVTNVSDNVLSTPIVTSLPVQPNITTPTSPASVSSSSPPRPLTQSSNSTSSSNDYSNITTKAPLNNSTTVKTSTSSLYSSLNTTTIVTSSGTISTPSITSLNTTTQLCTSTENQQCSSKNGSCTCVCNKDLIGRDCAYGKNETAAVLNKEKGPKRNFFVEITIDKTFEMSLNNPSSSEYINLYTQVLNVLEVAFKRAAPEYFFKVIIHGFRNGSIIVNSTAVYTYPNNQTGIDFINEQLESELNNSLDQSLPELEQKMGVTVRKSVQPESPTITNPPLSSTRSQLKPMLTMTIGQTRLS
ncbi:uncharacterized protein LOC142662570 [Rhinoderma darwinii]|uniref:uncharacterized protein LOC142662570 n=1 Tax=Rhinoderma darwinii TaxID=43563 RepID=UPI003F675169